MPRFLCFTKFFWIPFAIPRASPLKPHLTRFKSHTKIREAPASIQEHWHPLTLLFIFNMLNWYAIENPCWMTRKHSSTRSTQEVGPKNMSSPGLTLQQYRHLQQLCPQSKVGRLLFCSVLAVQCCCKTQWHCKKDTKSWVHTLEQVQTQHTILSNSHFDALQLCPVTSQAVFWVFLSVQVTTTVTKAPSCDLQVDLPQ